MEYEIEITPASGEDVVKDAESAFESFLTLYHPLLSKIDHYLEHVMSEIGPTYARAYMPWHTALHDLCSGVFLISKKIPLPDTERFIEALKTFSFESAIQFLYDLCLSCRILLERDWIKKFQEHIHTLLFSMDVLNRQSQLSRTR